MRNPPHNRRCNHLNSQYDNQLRGPANSHPINQQFSQPYSHLCNHLCNLPLNQLSNLRRNRPFNRHVSRQGSQRCIPLCSPLFNLVYSHLTFRQCIHQSNLSVCLQSSHLLNHLSNQVFNHLDDQLHFLLYSRQESQLTNLSRTPPGSQYFTLVNSRLFNHTKILLCGQQFSRVPNLVFNLASVHRRFLLRSHAVNLLAFPLHAQPSFLLYNHLNNRPINQL